MDVVERVLKNLENSCSFSFEINSMQCIRILCKMNIVELELSI